jgi:hypothetical protein
MHLRIHTEYQVKLGKDQDFQICIFFNLKVEKCNGQILAKTNS